MSSLSLYQGSPTPGPLPVRNRAVGEMGKCARVKLQSRELQVSARMCSKLHSRERRLFGLAREVPLVRAEANGASRTNSSAFCSRSSISASGDRACACHSYAGPGRATNLERTAALYYFLLPFTYFLPTGGQKKLTPVRKKTNKPPPLTSCL